MTIVCGTDFSDLANQAARTAATIAKRLGDQLELVHVGRNVEHDAMAREVAGAKLRAQADNLRERGVTVNEKLLPGNADEALADLAVAARARLVVVGALGHRLASRWLIGSVAERTAQISPVPVLIVRDAKLDAWLAGERVLRVLVGADRGESSNAALRWPAELRKLGPSDVIAAHVAWPPGEHARLGIKAPMNPDKLHPDVERACAADIEGKLPELGGEGRVEVKIVAGLGRVDNHLVSLAESEKVDLLVLGTHQRSGFSKLWHGSVSSGALHLAPMNVACVPMERK